MSVINKLGRRKSSVARIYLKSGKGKITINKRDHKDYFTTDVLQYKIFQPFELTGTKGKTPLLMLMEEVIPDKSKPSD